MVYYVYGLILFKIQTIQNPTFKIFGIQMFPIFLFSVFGFAPVFYQFKFTPSDMNQTEWRGISYYLSNFVKFAALCYLFLKT